MKPSVRASSVEGLRSELKDLRRQVQDLHRIIGDVGGTEPLGEAEVEAGGGGYSATYTVAASDASASAQANADFVCDGTNDEVQINAALAACETLSGGSSGAAGGRVLLSEGTFYIGATAITGATSSTLQGQGPTATKLAQQAASSYTIDCNTLGFTLSDLWVEGYDASDDGYGVRLRQNYARVERVRFWGLGTDGTFDGSLHFDSSFNIVDACEFYQCGYSNGGGYAVYLAASSVTSIVRGCSFVQSGAHAVYTLAQKVHVVDNYIDAAQTWAASNTAIEVGNYSIVTGNIAASSGGTATITAGTGAQVANNVLL